MLETKEIIEILAGIDAHMKKFEAMMSLMKEIKSTLIEIKNNQERTMAYEFQKLRKDQNDILIQLKKRGMPEINKYEQELDEVRQLFNSDEWPVAVPQELICGEDQNRINQRSECIFDLLITEPIRGKKFLDYGCGQGHTTLKAVERDASVVIGYDVDLTKCVSKDKKFTDSFDVVRSNGPYDIILVHDVLDHIRGIDPIQALVQIRSVLANQGKVYINNHPWSSRHGGHLYTQKNKAFAHLIFDDVELTRIDGLQAEYNIKVVTPLDTYRYWIKEAGLDIVSESPIKNNVEDFFLKPSLVNQRLSYHFKEPETMATHLSISFVEYVLQHYHSNEQIF